MRLTSRTSKLPLARVLALVALLCTGALQAQEAGHAHWHGLEDSYSQCLLCKGSGNAALPMEASVSLQPAAMPADAPRQFTVPRPAAASPFEARGPPAYS